jgi:hypothetical protein
MLGCHDFCGYYEWTFHYLRRNFGEAALKDYWQQAIAADSQQHYLNAARQEGLRGLHETWSQTGVDEKCDWTVTLDEPGNVLRLDMRECPSKGFLLDNDLNADEDYCDHCMGWIGPALQQIGVEVAAHEHNHCGQCWWEIQNRYPSHAQQDRADEKVARSLREKRVLILNWFRAGGTISAGIVEGFNNKLKLITRKSYGFRTQEAYETALYHNLGALPEPEFTHEFC